MLKKQQVQKLSYISYHKAKKKKTDSLPPAVTTPYQCSVWWRAALGNLQEYLNSLPLGATAQSLPWFHPSGQSHLTLKDSDQERGAAHFHLYLCFYTRTRQRKQCRFWGEKGVAKPGLFVGATPPPRPHLTENSLLLGGGLASPQECL